MRARVFIIAATTASSLIGTQVVDAAELKIFSIPMRSSFDKIGPQFERSTGHKISIKYAPSAPLMKQIDSGEPFDLVITFPAHIDALIKRSKVVAGSRADLVRSGIGLAVMKGASKPDISNADALKRALLDASSISFAANGPSGVHFSGLIERLGIAVDVKPKLRAVKTGSEVLPPVAKGEAQIGIVSLPFILAAPGVDLVGPLPSELQHYVVYSSGIGSAAKEMSAVRAFLEFLTQPDALTVMKANGLEPAAAR